MTNSVCKIKSARVWELDAIRGLLIIAMLAAHLWDMVYLFCIQGVYKIDPYAWVETTDPLHFWFDWGSDGVIYMSFVNKPLINVWRLVMQASYFLISGICCTFSRDHLKGSIKLLVWGISLSAYTYVLYLWTGVPALFMRYNVIMCMALCHMAYEFLFKNARSKTLIIASIFILLVGYYLMLINPIYSDIPLLHPFGIRHRGDPGEYFPVFPYLGWLLIGVTIGRKWYAEKTSQVPSKTTEVLTRPVQWFGKNSGVIFLVHVALYRTAFPAIGYMLHIM